MNKICKYRGKKEKKKKKKVYYLGQAQKLPRASPDRVYSVPACRM
jgi:hypothetical protein